MNIQLVRVGLASFRSVRSAWGAFRKEMLLFSDNIVFTIYNCCETYHMKFACTLGSAYAPVFSEPYQVFLLQDKNRVKIYMYIMRPCASWQWVILSEGYFMIQDYDTRLFSVLWWYLRQRQIALADISTRSTFDFLLVIHCMFHRWIFV